MISLYPGGKFCSRHLVHSIKTEVLKTKSHEWKEGKRCCYSKDKI